MSIATIKYIHFHNNTELPIMLDSWIDGSNRLHHIKINPGEKQIIHSSVGEWHINTMFESNDDRNKWKEKGLDLYRYLTIGKFRSNRSASGNYSWMEDKDLFECIYTESDTVILPKKSNAHENSETIQVKVLITFTQKIQ